MVRWTTLPKPQLGGPAMRHSVARFRIVRHDSEIELSTLPHDAWMSITGSLNLYLSRFLKGAGPDVVERPRLFHGRELLNSPSLQDRTHKKLVPDEGCSTECVRCTEVAYGVTH